MSHELLTRTWVRGTSEYLRAEMQSEQLIEDSIEVAFTFDRENYIQGEWYGDVAKTRRCRAFITDAELPAGAQTVDVFVLATDNPEQTLVHVGSLNIT